MSENVEPVVAGQWGSANGVVVHLPSYRRGIEEGLRRARPDYGTTADDQENDPWSYGGTYRHPLDMD